MKKAGLHYTYFLIDPRNDQVFYDRVGSRQLRTVTLPHHRTCRFQHPAVEPSG